MTADKRLNLWLASDTSERDALAAVEGVALGDFCLVGGENLYVAADVDGGAFEWLPIAGLATSGPFGLGGSNDADTTSRRIFDNSAVTFRALYDGTPSSVTLSAGTNSNWSTLPTVTSPSAEGFWVSGSSNTIAAGVAAWTRGSYSVAY